MTETMKGRTCLITGATNGIGKETARRLAGMGANVVLVGRSAERGRAAMQAIQAETGNPQVHFLTADLSSLADVRRLAEEVRQKFPQLHVLLNNVGAFYTERLTTIDGYELTLALNHLGHFLLTGLLLDLLLASAPARIINVSSLAHRVAAIDFNDLQHERSYSPWVVYGRSKLANIYFSKELARRLKGSGVTANALHPGYVRSNFALNNRGFARVLYSLGQLAAIPVERGAETSVYLASSPAVAQVSGEYFANSRLAQSSPASHAAAAAARLWQVSLDLIGKDAKLNPIFLQA